jgi:hypothetical protein
MQVENNKKYHLWTRPTKDVRLFDSTHKWKTFYRQRKEEFEQTSERCTYKQSQTHVEPQYQNGEYNGK